MSENITQVEAVIFALAVYNTVHTANPTLPHMVIIETANRVDFKADNIPQQVRDIVDDLKSTYPWQSKHE